MRAPEGAYRGPPGAPRELGRAPRNVHNYQRKKKRKPKNSAKLPTKLTRQMLRAPKASGPLRIRVSKLGVPYARGP
jgi:hypothetical protein